MDRRTALVTLGVLGSLSWTGSALAKEPLVVIVHKGNSVDSLPAGQLKAIFETRRVHWSGDLRIVPFNFPAKQPLRVEFDRAVLHMDPGQVARYWIDRKVRGGAHPPRTISSAKLLVRVVAKLRGAIGYVPASLASSDVKVVAKVSR